MFICVKIFVKIQDQFIEFNTYHQFTEFNT